MKLAVWRPSDGIAAIFTLGLLCRRLGRELGGVGRDGLRDWYGSALRNFLALRCDKFGLARNFAQKMRYLGFEGPDRALI